MKPQGAGRYHTIQTRLLAHAIKTFKEFPILTTRTIADQADFGPRTVLAAARRSLIPHPDVAARPVALWSEQAGTQAIAIPTPTVRPQPYLRGPRRSRRSAPA